MMFSDCTSLEKAPNLPATELADYCYCDMFYGCTSLEKAPALPATTLTEDCYSYMFKRCTGLKEIPELHATKVADGCYAFMFDGCTKLRLLNKESNEWKFKVDDESSSVDTGYDDMFSGLKLGDLVPDKDGYVTLYSQYPTVKTSSDTEPAEDESSKSSLSGKKNGKFLTAIIRLICNAMAKSVAR